ELPGRACVVVEPTHERRHELVLDAERVEVASYLGEMLAAGIAQRVADRRRLPEELLHGRWLGGDVVESPERVATRLRARPLVQLSRVLLEPGAQLIEVGRTAGSVADRVQLQAIFGDAEPPEEGGVELDHLGVARRVVRPDRLDVELPVLTESPLLRASVAVDRLVGVELLRLRLSVQAVLQGGRNERSSR